ncbi:hypothetical protein [Bifidobacterium felsineum]|uniref:hypothetical protein n=1 Tax=Bifidobacterium felsineum TaxID=2045440 RepID=UPI001BDBF782|nr:hypothetical protein [Bifidobacterium felsineum]MBT1164651.1 hypothetical protein [Bifidobacterium felsineum]
MNRTERHEFLESLSDFTLYETFYETGTQLGGTLVAVERLADAKGDTTLFRRIRAERFAMGDDRDDTGRSDRERQIQLIEQWNDRREELNREYEV